MFDVLLSDQEKEVKYKAREFVKTISPSTLRKMDREEIQYPTQYIKSLADQKLLGLRFPSKYGGSELNWVAESAVIEEVGVLGPALGCLYSLPTIVGEAIYRFGTIKQKEPILALGGTSHGVDTCLLVEPSTTSKFFEFGILEIICIPKVGGLTHG